MNKGQVAYEALGEFRNWRVGSSNTPMRSWVDLPDANKVEWEIIANAVINYKEDDAKIPTGDIENPIP